MPVQFGRRIEGAELDIGYLSQMFKKLGEDIDAVMERDPAARTRIDVIFSYPGFHALLFHRVAHAAWVRRWFFLGRFTSHLGRLFSGIEIHPGATIGSKLFIDHGMGVVIGETSDIGDNVTLYQGVTLGGTSLDSGKRHPTLEDDVIVGAGAKVLGPLTLGRACRVGSNAVVVKDVPAEATVVGIPAKEVVSAANKKKSAEEHPSFAAYGLSSDGIPDPVAKVINGLLDRVQTLSARIQELEDRLAIGPDAYSKPWSDETEQADADKK